MNEWLALLRVHEGGVTSLEGQFLNHGQPVAEYLAATFVELIQTEHLALGRPDPSGRQQVCVTRAGQARYLELNANGVREARDGR
ncbi:MAG: hypothetical protein ACRDTE_11880 [Pseudonocardiaceae bacterium]